MELNDDWEAYKVTFGRKYDSLNEIARRIIWEQNLKYIQKHNLEYDLGKHSYFLGLNEYADMTNEEFRSRFLGTRLRNVTKLGSTFISPENLKVLPPSVDWRKKGYVTPVKNQQQCGSCWAFSTTGSLEGQHFRKTGNLLSFSEQQLVDCSGNFGNYGCEGGLMDNAFQYIKQFGIESEEDYPYTASDGTCQYDKSKVVGTCTGHVDIPSGNEVALATAVATVGPISVAIDASHQSFQLYKGGIYNEPQCSTTQLDHGVLAVGYGIENNKHYWLVKNSWGASWGLAGYLKMSKDDRNQCGIATSASYPLV
jgi:cathepsin L